MTFAQISKRAILVLSLAAPLATRAQSDDPFSDLDDLGAETPSASAPDATASSTPPAAPAPTSTPASAPVSSGPAPASVASASSAPSTPASAPGDFAGDAMDPADDLSLDDALQADGGSTVEKGSEKASDKANDKTTDPANNATKVADAPAQSSTIDDPNALSDKLPDDELDSMLADSDKDQKEKAPNPADADGVKDLLSANPAPPPPDAAAPDFSTDSGDDAAIAGLEQSLDGSAADPSSLVTNDKSNSTVAPALRDGRAPTPALPSLDGNLDPSDAFARVPVRPQMGDQNWKKYAGPMLEKNYRLRKGDTLWGTSEKLFGNPYLWPKVWQLNAYITNANVVDPGMELEFTPGNPNSAPVIAMLNVQGHAEGLEFVETKHRLGFIDQLETMLQAQMRAPDPPFKTFLLEELPKPQAKLPVRGEEGKLFFIKGDEFALPKVADGTYSVVRGESLASKRSEGNHVRAFRLDWIGSLQVKAGVALVTRAFREMEEGDAVVAETFAISPLAINEGDLGQKESGKVKFVPIQEGFRLSNPAFSLVGVRFSGKNEGPPPGALLTFTNKGRSLGTGLLVHRSGRFGTLWVAESRREILPTDTIR